MQADHVPSNSSGFFHWVGNKSKIDFFTEKSSAVGRAGRPLPPNGVHSFITSSPKTASLAILTASVDALFILVSLKFSSITCCIVDRFGQSFIAAESIAENFFLMGNGRWCEGRTGWLSWVGDRGDLDGVVLIWEGVVWVERVVWTCWGVVAGGSDSGVAGDNDVGVAGGSGVEGWMGG